MLIEKTFPWILQIIDVREIVERVYQHHATNRQMFSIYEYVTLISLIMELLVIK